MGMFSQLAQGVDWSSMGQMILRIAAVLLCLVIHEVSHGLAAYHLGDPTAKQSHRLSLNPLRHLDPFGLIMMIAVGFGWAKPVPVDPRYVIFSNATLADMARRRPTDLEGFLEVSGVGEVKARKYGKAFLRTLAQVQED